MGASQDESQEPQPERLGSRCLRSADLAARICYNYEGIIEEICKNVGKLEKKNTVFSFVSRAVSLDPSEFISSRGQINQIMVLCIIYQGKA